MPKKVKEAAKKFNIEKYVLLEWSKITDKKAKKDIEKIILAGDLLKRAELKKLMKKMNVGVTKADKVLEQVFVKKSELKDDLSKLDHKSKQMLKELLEKNLI